MSVLQETGKWPASSISENEGHFFEMPVMDYVGIRCFQQAEVHQN
jgi:hypothetical protein